jgi:hypothetical protein
LGQFCHLSFFERASFVIWAAEHELVVMGQKAPWWFPRSEARVVSSGVSSFFFWWGVVKESFI